MVCTLPPNCLVIIPLHMQPPKRAKIKDKDKKRKKREKGKFKVFHHHVLHICICIYRYVNGYLEKKRQKIDMYKVREVMVRTFPLLIPSLSFKKNRIASYLLHSSNSSHLISPYLDVENFFFSSFVYSYISFIVHLPSSIMFDERSSSSNSNSSSAGGCR